MRLTLWTAFWVFLVDQATKYVVVHWLDLINKLAIDVLPPMLNFRMAWNRGVNFGLFANDAAIMRWVLIALAFAITAFVLYWMARDKPPAQAQMAAGLLVGGALGKVIDRILFGAVAAFLNMSCCGLSNPFAFNVADIAIFVGAFGLVLLPHKRKTP